MIMGELRTETIGVKVTARAKLALEYRAFKERLSVSSLIWRYLQDLPLEEWAAEADSFLSRIVRNPTNPVHKNSAAIRTSSSSPGVVGAGPPGPSLGEPRLGRGPD